MSIPDRVRQRIRTSGLIVAAGLAIQTASLYWASPGAFIVFILVGGSLVAAGVLAFLWTMLTMSGS